MKKVLHFMLVAAVAILICLPSCQKDDELVGVESIVGKWKITSAKIDGTKIEDIIGKVWTFKDNGKFTGCIEADDELIN